MSSSAWPLPLSPQLFLAGDNGLLSCGCVLSRAWSPSCPRWAGRRRRRIWDGPLGFSDRSNSTHIWSGLPLCASDQLLALQDLPKDLLEPVLFLFRQLMWSDGQCFKSGHWSFQQKGTDSKQGHHKKVA